MQIKNLSSIIDYILFFAEAVCLFASTFIIIWIFFSVSILSNILKLLPNILHLTLDDFIILFLNILIVSSFVLICRTDKPSKYFLIILILEFKFPGFD